MTRPLKFGTLNATVTALASLGVIQTCECERLTVQMVVGVANLSDFLIEGRCHPSAGYSKLADVTGDFTTPVNPIIKASGDLNAAGFGATVHFFIMDVRGLYDVKISAAGTASTVAVSWGAL